MEPRDPRDVWRSPVIRLCVAVVLLTGLVSGAAGSLRGDESQRLLLVVALVGLAIWSGSRTRTARAPRPLRGWRRGVISAALVAGLLALAIPALEPLGWWTTVLLLALWALFLGSFHRIERNRRRTRVR